MAAARARELAKNGTPLDTAVASSNAGVAFQFNMFDILAAAPGSAGDATAMQTPSMNDRNYSLVLAGIAE